MFLVSKHTLSLHDPPAVCEDGGTGSTESLVSFLVFFLLASTHCYHVSDIYAQRRKQNGSAGLSLHLAHISSFVDHLSRNGSHMENAPGRINNLHSLGILDVIK